MPKEHLAEWTLWWGRSGIRPAAGTRRHIDTDISSYGNDGRQSDVLWENRGGKSLPTGVGYRAELSGPLHWRRGLEEIAPFWKGRTGIPAGASREIQIGPGGLDNSRFSTFAKRSGLKVAGSRTRVGRWLMRSLWRFRYRGGLV